jgi:hypothetical protein
MQGQQESTMLHNKNKIHITPTSQLALLLLITILEQTHSFLTPITSTGKKSVAKRILQHQTSRLSPFHHAQTSRDHTAACPTTRLLNILSSNGQQRKRSAFALEMSANGVPSASSNDGSQCAPISGPPHFVILPGFGNADVDYGRFE